MGFGHLILDDIFHSLFNLFLWQSAVIGFVKHGHTKDDENAEATGLLIFTPDIASVAWLSLQVAYCQAWRQQPCIPRMAGQ